MLFYSKESFAIRSESSASSREAMVTVVNDWVSFYINYYKKQLSGEQQEQDKFLQEFRQELDTLSASFLEKYRNFLKSS